MSHRNLFHFDGWTPKQWRKIDDDKYSSTVSYFKGGYRKGNVELRVWSGAPNEDGTLWSFEGSEPRKEPLLVEVIDHEVVINAVYFKNTSNTNEFLRRYMKGN